ncbi:PAS domain-containing sensor histidine kinase [Halorhabdus amylolytica]|uniref:PAS domain-containing sensor histidine kinase n=1 Tax=Halorhabdus amylolytica TaxID=2559573 RepID=UPI0010AA3FC2|nr:PAS domain-containing sensor histidine kinase [Halorhabdus amylolytica]
MNADRNRFGVLFELTEDAVAEIEMVDQIPVVRTVNPAFEEVFGYERTEIVGESLNEFIVPDHRSSEATSFDDRTADGKSNWATVSRRTDDGLREFLYRGVPYEREGQRFGLAIYTDVTDRRRRERHHEVLHRVLRHNLRNDLTQISLSTEILVEELEDATLLEHARRIGAAADDLEKLSHAAGRVRDVMGGVTDETSSVDLAGTLRDVIDRYRGNDEVVFETDVSSKLPVAGDRRLFDAIDALVENSLEHGAASDGSGDDPATIRVAARLDGEEVEVTITDEGPGIPEYARAAVFDERPISQLSHSSGLGLWLAKWLVEGFGGRLGYERRGGRTTVSVRLPRSQ